MNHLWLSISNEDLETEQLQAVQEGRDTSRLEAGFRSLLTADLGDPATRSKAERLLDDVLQSPLDAKFVFHEPNDMDSIAAARPATLREKRTPVDYESGVHGAWLGRCCGCLLGKPVEGWKRPRLWGYLKDTGQWPLREYISIDVPARTAKQYDVAKNAPFKENIFCMPEDDDLNYTVAALAILQKYGRAFTSDHVAEFWLASIPLLRTCTAERVAYKNMANGLRPPNTATFRNPYREWIGAQIRADFWGYVNPGEPLAAADMAWSDARVSHVKNGIYGAMWVAGMVSEAFVESDMQRIIRAGLACIPEKSRLAEAVRRQLNLRSSETSVHEVVERIHSEWDENRAHDWCHVIPNAEIVAIALLWGEGDFGRSICMAVEAAFDTDCNGATVGSILGASLGRKTLPPRWIEPLSDTLLTGVQGYHQTKISDLAEATALLLKKE